MKRMCDLSSDLVEEIFARIPITSLRAVRSTCKSWEFLSKNLVLGKAVANRQQFLRFMVINSKLYSLRFDIHKGKGKGKDVDLSINQVDLLNDQIKISKVFYCDGLVLYVIKDNSRLLVWNPYLVQIRWIRPKRKFHGFDTYAFGYENNNSKRNHKILRLMNDHGTDSIHVEIYNFSSDSWRVLDVVQDWGIGSYQRGSSLKGNTYFFAKEKKDIYAKEIRFLLCFDFTTEKFGPRLPLPFQSYNKKNVTLSSVREEQLALLQQRRDSLEIWVTTDINPKALSWSKFLKVVMTPLFSLHIEVKYRTSFFIDEEEKVAVVFELGGGYTTPRTSNYHTAFIIGDKGYMKSVSLSNPSDSYPFPRYCPLLVCSSSYHPSLVQIKRCRKRNHLDD